MAEQTIFITGCSTGLGRATALLFANRGWRVLATMRNPADARELATTPGVTVLRLDVTDPAQIEDAARRALELGPVDVVFNNAGYDLAGPLEAMTDEQIVRQLDTNLLGVIRTTKAFIPHFRERRTGVFIATTSIGGLIALPFNTMYHATKWALEGWNEALAFEMSKFGVRAKTVAPGGIKTDFFNRSLVLANHPAYGDLAAKVLAVFADPSRAAAYATPEQIAEVVFEAATDGKDQLRYLAGEDAKALWAQKQAVGAEEFHKLLDKMFFG